MLATPAAPTARLLAEVAPAAAAELAGIEYASMAVVTLAFRADDVSGLDDSSGFLVPPVDGRAIKASTFSFAKWGWVREAGAAARAGAPAHLARPARRGGDPAAHRRRAGRGLAGRPGRGRRARRRPGRRATCSAGAAGCRSTPSATSTGSPGSAPRSPTCPAWRSAARRTTASGSRRSSPRPAAAVAGLCPGARWSAAPRSTPRAAGRARPVTRSPASRPVDHAGQVGAVQPADQGGGHAGHRVERAVAQPHRALLAERLEALPGQQLLAGGQRPLGAHPAAAEPGPFGRAQRRRRARGPRAARPPRPARPPARWSPPRPGSRPAAPGSARAPGPRCPPPRARRRRGARPTRAVRRRPEPGAQHAEVDELVEVEGRELAGDARPRPRPPRG